MKLVWGCLLGFLEERVYSDPVPKTIEQLKNNIRREPKKLKIDMVKRAIDNMIPRVQNLLCRKGAWFEKLLKDYIYFFMYCKM